MRSTRTLVCGKRMHRVRPPEELGSKDQFFSVTAARLRTTRRSRRGLVRKDRRAWVQRGTLSQKHLGWPEGTFEVRELLLGEKKSPPPRLFHSVTDV